MEVHDRVIVPKSFLPVEQSIIIVRSLRGVIVLWVVDREYHLSGCGCTEHAVSEPDDGVHRFGVRGGLGHQLMFGPDAPCDALSVYVVSLCIAVSLLL